jgi:predicted Rossmann fold nucleotide-binding protein DprA/Smf involved in DNA uptake
MQFGEGGGRRKEMNTVALDLADATYPALLRERLGDNAPARITTCGNLELLALTKTALFCSIRCPGHAILGTYDQAARWRDEGRCVISGFHSPVENECLQILLRGKQPIIICPARSLEGMRVPAAWRDGFAQGRVLLLSPFQPLARRQSATLARQRNEFAAALADELYIPYATPGGSLEKLLQLARLWGIPLLP